MPKVAVLNDALINKIAAGEVVERPASVIKELVENALDAGAKTIRVSLSGGGLTKVSVVDDGSGMSREDATLAMTRHATSKLRELDGLFTLRTMGFRGEALPAIASVSRFRLVTSEPGAEAGTQVEVQGGAGLEVTEAPPVGGTRIFVEDLFFNTPARRKFMRQEQTELRHCEEAVIRIALAHPGISFFVDHDGRALFSSPATPGDLRERIAAALGAEVHRFLLPVEERRLGIAVEGFIAAPEYNLPNARGVYTFVNRRYVRDRALNAAINRAFSDVLPGGRQPVVVLFIELDPGEVDVNVHPQKLEVRFQDVRGVADALSAGIIRALREAEQKASARDAPAGGEGAAQYALAVERFLARAQTAADGSLPLGVADGAFAREDLARAPAFGEARPTLNEAPPPGFFCGLRFIGGLARRFWLCEGQGGTLVVIDPHAAAERARFEALRRGLGQGGPGRSLFCASVELPAPEAKRIAQRLPALWALGLEVEAFGGTSFAVRALPGALEGVDARALLLELAAALPDPDSGPLDEGLLLPALRVCACHAARAAPEEPTAEARAQLFRALDGASHQLPCRHGRIVVAELPLLELERRARGLDRH